MLLTAAVGGVLSLACFLSSPDSRDPIRTVIRPENGSGNEKRHLWLELEGKKYPFSFSLLEIPLDEAEVQAHLDAAAKRLEGIVLKNNRDMQSVTSDISLPSVIPDTQITLQWYLDSWEYVEPGGTVKNILLEEPVSVQIQAVLELQGQRKVWEREMKICPVENPDEKQKIQMLEYQMNLTQKGSSEQELELPRSVLGQEVTWYPEGDHRWLSVMMLTLGAVCAVYIGQRKEEERLQRQRERNMQMDYPEIVSRLSLYMGAGVSTRKAWERIVDTYEKKSGEGKKQREAYEEMRTALHEMQSGVAEALAYERFGTRCRLPPYLKLGALLSQNLRKGTRNLADLLEEESREAFENRKALAKKMGEECESRLLLPMILMLLTILIMVMYPAIVSFQM